MCWSTGEFFFPHKRGDEGRGFTHHRKLWQRRLPPACRPPLRRIEGRTGLQGWNRNKIPQPTPNSSPPAPPKAAASRGKREEEQGERFLCRCEEAVSLPPSWGIN